MSQNSPAPRSNYFGLSSSTGKQVNTCLYQPVRIRVSPHFKENLPASEEKPLLQPVRLKHLLGLDSLYHDSPLNKRKSCSTSHLYNSGQKNASQRRTQFLNAQSCGRNGNAAQKSVALTRESISGRVRRQLYNAADSPSRSSSHPDREKDIDNVQPSRKSSFVRNADNVKQSKSMQNQKMRKSNLLASNSVKDSTVRTVGTKSRASTVVTRKSQSTVNNLKQKRYEFRKSQSTSSKDSDDSVASDESIIPSKQSKSSRESLADEGRDKKGLKSSNAFSRQSVVDLKKNENCSTEGKNVPYNSFIRPSVIMGPKGKRNASKDKGHDRVKVARLNEEKQNLQNPRTVPDETHLSRFSLIMFQNSLEENIRSTEENLTKMKETLLAVKCLLSNTTMSETFTQTETSIESRKITKDTSVSNCRENDIEEQKSPQNLDLVKNDKTVTPDVSNNTARLSTITEVSCEADESKSEKLIINQNRNSLTALKTPRRRSLNESSGTESTRRRSARLAAMNLDTPKKQEAQNDSFIRLENELCVVHDFSKENVPNVVNSKIEENPAIKETLKWNPAIERPLQEYLALKTTNSFLVTPDIKRFQSMLDTSETPALSRKSMTLSKKVFTELCALYAESPK